MSSPIYINAPFSKEEHDSIESLAREQGRSKGQQLRHLALAALFQITRPTKKGAKSK